MIKLCAHPSNSPSFPGTCQHINKRQDCPWLPAIAWFLPLFFWRLVLDDRRALLSVHAPHKCYLRQVFITGRASHDLSFVSLITAIVYLPPSTHLYKQQTLSQSLYVRLHCRNGMKFIPLFSLKIPSPR